MSFTYSGDPSASPLDEVRFWIGDTESSDAQLTDAEIKYLLRSNNDSVTAAALEGCRRLISKYSRYVDQKTGDIDIKYSQRITQLQMVIAHIQSGMLPAPYAGGISKSDIEQVQDDEDRQGPTFALGMMDNPPHAWDDDYGCGGNGGTGGVI
jgi:hypothetical protein